MKDGYHPIPDDMLASVVTSLSMASYPILRPEIAIPTWSLEHLVKPQPSVYRAIYKNVGADWLWFSRLAMTDDELNEITHSRDVEIYHLQGYSGGEGLLELDFRETGSCELAFFGLSDSLIGGPAGRWLMNRAIERAWARPIERFWVHTCTFDHSAALDFYRRSGFEPFSRQVEIFRDPRLTGLVDADVAKHVPLIG
jgi:GNAT superfamily N-acetyltransferase